MENEVWDTDNLKPWQIDRLLEKLKRYREEEWEAGDVRDEEEYRVILGILCDNRFDGKMTVEQMSELYGRRLEAEEAECACGCEGSCGNEPERTDEEMCEGTSERVENM